MIVLRNGPAELNLDPAAGGRVAQLLVDGLPVLARVHGRATHWGSFVMAPWAGRIRRGRFTFAGTTYDLPTDRMPPHAIHGTVLDRPWTVVPSTTGTSAELECALGDSWPWRGRVRQMVSLEGDGATFRIEVHAVDASFPASAGWHPWFRRRLAHGGPVQITLDAAAMLPRDADGIPTGVRAPVTSRPWDDCFVDVRWPVVLHWPGALRLEVGGDTRFAVVYDQLDDAVCVEPQTGPPDALTLEPVVVSPEAPLVTTMTWTWIRRGRGGR